MNFDCEFDFRPRSRRSNGGERSRFVFRGDILGGNTKTSSDATEQTASTAGANSPSTVVKGNKSNLGTSISVAKGGSLMTSDPQVAQSAFDAIVQTVKTAINAVQNGAASTVGAVADQAKTTAQDTDTLTNALLSQQQADAANVNSGGQTDFNATLVKIVLGIAGLFGMALLAIFFFRPKAKA